MTFPEYMDAFWDGAICGFMLCALILFLIDPKEKRP